MNAHWTRIVRLIAVSAVVLALGVMTATAFARHGADDGIAGTTGATQTTTTPAAGNDDNARAGHRHRGGRCEATHRHRGGHQEAGDDRGAHREAEPGDDRGGDR